MKADLCELNMLLEIQDLDSGFELLKRKSATLPVHQQIDALMKQRSQAKENLVAAQTVLSDAMALAERAEDDVVPVRERLTRNQARVDAGAMDSKALSSAIEEIQHLKQRISDLEDIELKALDAVDDAKAGVASLQTSQSEIDQQLRVHLDDRDAAVAQLAAKAKELMKTRADLAGKIQPDLVSLYEKIKSRSSGVGVAKFEGRRCSGCGLEATVADYNHYFAAPADEVLRCAECTRILVKST